MKQEFKEQVVENDSLEVIKNTVQALNTSLPRLLIDLQSLKANSVKEGALNTPAPISYFESGQIDYLKQVLVLRQYIENLPDTLKCELKELIPPLCVFLYHELRQRQSKEVYINFLARIVELKILPSANEVDNQDYFNTKHVISLSRNTYEHIMSLITQQEWLSILSVINQKFVFDIKRDSAKKSADSKPRTVLQKACSNLELGLGPSSFSFIKTIKVTNNTSILCMTLTQDNSTLLAASSDSTIYKWSLSSSTSQISQSNSKSAPKNPLPAPDLGLTYDEHFEVDAGESERLYVELRGHAGPVYWVCVKGEHALSASHDGSVVLWNLQTERMLYKYRGHSKWPVFHVTFSPVVPYFCTASHDSTAKLWRTDHSSPLRVFAGHSGPVTRCEFHPNGSYVVTASEDMSCRLWDVSSGNCARVVPFKSYISAMSISPNGKVLACALLCGEVLLWDIATTKVLRKYSIESAPQTNGYHGDNSHKLQKKVISHCMFIHENTLVTGDSHGNVVSWDTRLHSKLHSKPIQQVNVAGRVRGLSSNKSGLVVVGVM